MGGPLRSSHPSMVTAHDHHQQQQRGHAAAAASAVADVDVDFDVVDSSPTTRPRALPSPAPLRVSFASLPRFETAFPNALSSRRRSLDETSRRKKELFSLPSSSSPQSPFAKNDAASAAADGPAATSSSKPSKPTLAAAPHDSKLALFYNVYGPLPTEAAGRGESARAARDALALFHAVYGPPKHLQLLSDEEDEASSPSGELPSSSPRSSSASLSPRQRPASPSSSSSSSQSPRATTAIAPAAPLSLSSAARRRLSFAKPLARGVVLERRNRFTMRVRLSETDEIVSCHCPVTGALGGLGMSAFEGAGAPCLVSRVVEEDDEEAVAENGNGARKKKYYSRKTPYTVEAVSLADPAGPPSWVGINQMAANRYIEHFWNAGALPELSSSGSCSSSNAAAAADAGDGGENGGETSSSPLSSQDGSAPLVRETRIGDTRSRVDFAASGGRDLVEVKCPLDALQLLRDDSDSSWTWTSTSPSSATRIRPNPVLAAAAALRAQTAGERLARLPRARRAAMYERAARHANVLAEHLATAKKRERAAAARARAAARRSEAALPGASSSSSSSSSSPSSSSSDSPSLQRALESFEEEGLEEELEEEGLEEELEEEQRARALLIQCFQFDAPPVRGMLPPPEGADPSSDGRAAVSAAMRSAAKAGVETWQVNMRFDERGVELLDCFKLDLFPRADSSSTSSSSSSSSAATTTKMKKKKNKGAAAMSKNKSSPSLTAARAAASASGGASSFESFSSFSSSSGDESEDGGALAAA